MEVFLVNVDDETSLCLTELEIAQIRYSEQFRLSFPDIWKKIEKIVYVKDYRSYTCKGDSNRISSVWKHKIQEYEGIMDSFFSNNIIDILYKAKTVFMQTCSIYAFNIENDQIKNFIDCLYKLCLAYNNKYKLNSKYIEKYTNVFFFLVASIYAMEESCPEIRDINPTSKKNTDEIIMDIFQKALPILDKVCQTDIYKVEKASFLKPFLMPVKLKAIPSNFNILETIIDKKLNTEEKITKIQELISRGASINPRLDGYLEEEKHPGMYDNVYSDFPLLFALDGKDEKLVMFLLEKGMDPTITTISKGGWYPIHYAVRFSMYNVVRFILEKYPNEINKKTIDNITPLEIAEYDKNEKMIELLEKSE